MVGQRGRELFEVTKSWYVAHERALTAGALLLGFVIDSFTLQRIDLLFENLVLLTHLAIVGGSIVYINFYDAGRLKRRTFSFVRTWIPLLMQFSFGALFSGFLIFYTRSASLSASWPFLLFLLALLIGNETFRKRYERFIFQSSVFYIALTSYLIFSVPILVNRIGAFIFLLSIVLSIGIATLLFYLLRRYIPEHLSEVHRRIMKSVSIISIVFIALYFTNILPPIPLSLEEADVYHRVARTGNSYEVEEEPEVWYEKLLPYERVQLEAGKPLYVFSSIFAPTNINTPIVHHWQKKNDDGNRWESISRLSFPITGGSDTGYRGFTLKQNITPGWWRVDIETRRGQRLGRVLFKVRPADGPVETETLVK